MTYYGSDKMSQEDVTVVELRQQLRSLGLPMSGTKADILNRLSTADGARSPESGLATPKDMEVTEEGEKVLVIPSSSQRLSNPVSNATNRRKSESLRPTADLQSVKGLLSEFDATNANFECWSEQVRQLQSMFCLDDNSVKLLIGMKLTGKARQWLHSRVEHLRMTTEELLKGLKVLFDHRPRKPELRREFEKRTWETNETFAEYAHDKMILAGRAGIKGEDLTQEMVDGIPDVPLRNQALLFRFTTPDDLIEAFAGIKLPTNAGKAEATGRVDHAKGKTMNNTRERPRCHNCNRDGHRTIHCRLPRREGIGCFRCGQSGHRSNECKGKSTGAKPSQQFANDGDRRRWPDNKSTTSQNEESTTALAPSKSVAAVERVRGITKDASAEPPYILEFTYTIMDTVGDQAEYKVTAIIDSGSPVSLLKSSYVPARVCRPLETESTSYCGLNNVPLKILGVYNTTIHVNSTEIKVKFLVVPDDTISFNALLGRDFLSSSNIKVVIDGKCKVIVDNKQITNSSLRETDNAIWQLYQINCIEESKPMELNINPEIDFKTREQLKNIYLNTKRNEGETVEAEIDNNVQMDIVLKHTQPVCFRPRRLSFADKEKLQIILDELLEKKIIRESNSPYASPIVLVRKKTGDLRLCVDYRELNKNTIKDNFPTPLIDDHLDKLRDKRYFSCLDLQNGFYHVKMTESATKYTSFVTPLGQYEFNRMPFGLMNAPCVFQRYINNIFSQLIKENKILIYLDDILIATETVEENISTLERIFTLAERNNLVFRLDKCSFLYEEIVYLGYTVS